MVEREAFDKKILFFGGKGGVGKTTLAAATAVCMADRGRSVLLVSTDPAHSVADALDAKVGSEPTAVSPNLHAIEIDPEKETDRYVDDVKNRIAETTAPRLVAEVERQIDVARVSPGAEESALFDRFARIMQDLGPNYDTIIFDTAPTGHTLRLLSLPELMTSWIAGLIDQRGKVNALSKMWRNVGGAVSGKEDDRDPVLEALRERRTRFVFARDLLTDKDSSAFFFVITPERLPVLETERAVRALDKYGIPVGGVVLNRILPADEPGEFLAKRRALESEMIQRVEKSFAQYPIWQIPLYPSDVTGREALLRLGHSLLSTKFQLS